MGNDTLSLLVILCVAFIFILFAWILMLGSSIKELAKKVQRMRSSYISEEKFDRLYTLWLAELREMREKYGNRIEALEGAIISAHKRIDKCSRNRASK